MQHHRQYTSNTIASSANQHYFYMPVAEIRTSRVFYKISVGGTYRYSLLFSNVIDSTYSDGSISQKNLECEKWTIHKARLGRCNADAFFNNPLSHCETDVYDWTEIFFGNQVEKHVSPGEFFWSDPVERSFEKGEYLCVEITFSGIMIPYHEESLLPSFVYQNGDWVYDKRTPFAGMIGCDRAVEHKIAFLGDSITQGIGTPINSYAHWSALVSTLLGEKFACWNLGIGYARANDAASLGAWWQKVMQNDTIVLCLGANDILQNLPILQIKQDLTTIVMQLKRYHKQVVLQTIPPFEYSAEQISVWLQINEYIRTVLSENVDLLFDVVPLLCENKPNFIPKYGGHPNEKGCEIWAQELYKQILKLF